jgi:hypothetical protein
MLPALVSARSVTFVFAQSGIVTFTVADPILEIGFHGSVLSSNQPFFVFHRTYNR